MQLSQKKTHPCIFQIRLMDYQCSTATLRAFLNLLGQPLGNILQGYVDIKVGHI